MKGSAKHKIFLTDDHIVLRDALATLVNNFDGCQVVGVAANGIEFIEEIKKGKLPDIILLDLNMPIMDGFATAQWIKDNQPHIKILVLTMYDSEVALIRLLQMGVRGFLKKDIHPNDLKTAILSVADNGYYYCNNTTGKLASFFYKNNDGHAAIEKGLLNEKEIAFLKLASTELTYKEIAAALNITARSIDAYRDGLFEKLDVKSRVGMAIYAVKNGLVTF
jgi:two-component system, NarL family, invasion response regulator UvrY